MLPSELPEGHPDRVRRWKARYYMMTASAYLRGVRRGRPVRLDREELEAIRMHEEDPAISVRVASILDGLKPVPLEPGERRVISLDEWRTRKAAGASVARPDSATA